MDLISRKAAIEALEFEKDCLETLERINGVEDAIEVIQQLPSVAAVPLDKLCEYLNSVIYPCIICKESPGPQCNAERKGCWERVLTKWMEEQDAQKEN